MRFFYHCTNNVELEKSKADITSIMEEFGFCVIRGMREQSVILEKYKKLKESFNQVNDIRISGPLFFEMRNFQRLDCGDYSQVYARFSRMITRFFWNEPEEFTSEFTLLQHIRDVLSNRAFKYERGCYNLNDKPYYEMPKIIQYPSGGGFMNQHYDSYNTDGLLNIGLNIGMCVTKKGTHFKNGGLYYIHRNGQKAMLDDELVPGDIFIHDGAAPHGVHPIDPHLPLDLSTFSGRVSLILSSEAFPPKKA